MSSIHRLRRGLRGYLIRFAPHAFVSQRQIRTSMLLSPLVFLPILTHFTTTPTVPHTSSGLNPDHLSRSAEVKLQHLTEDAPGRLQTLYAQ